MYSVCVWGGGGGGGVRDQNTIGTMVMPGCSCCKMSASYIVAGLCM